MITIRNYVAELINLKDKQYTDFLENVSEALSEYQPFQWMIRGCINNSVKPFATHPERDRLFRKLLDANLTDAAYETVMHLTRELPTPAKEIEVHIFPSMQSGGGACFAPGKIIAVIPCDQHAPLQLRRNLAHEYSHTVRMIQKPQEAAHGYGDPVPYRMRDYLVFEGLAMVLSESLYPHPDFPPYEVSEENEIGFWERTDLDAVGISAYIKYMTMRVYEISARMVRSYLRKNQISILEAHSKSDDEIYWNSGYPYVR